MSDTLKTQDVYDIRSWAEKRGGKPAMVTDTGDGDDGGILRLMFPYAPESETEGLKAISWAEFACTFCHSELTFLYQEQTADGQSSNFNKFIKE